MPRIDFYVLPSQAPEQRLRLACRLVEKAYSLGHRIYIHTASAAQAQRLDDLLWSFRQGSFIPHTLQPAATDDLAPVLIGWGDSEAATKEWLQRAPGIEPADTSAKPEDPAHVLINLTDEVVPFFGEFQRVLETADQNPETLRKARDRFRHFRDLGLEPESHKL